MNVIPKSDILIQGIHCPSGVSVYTPDAIGRNLVADGLVTIDSKPLKIEEAELVPAVETATKRRK